MENLATTQNDWQPVTLFLVYLGRKYFYLKCTGVYWNPPPPSTPPHAFGGRAWPHTLPVAMCRVVNSRAAGVLLLAELMLVWWVFLLVCLVSMVSGVWDYLLIYCTVSWIRQALWGTFFVFVLFCLNCTISSVKQALWGDLCSFFFSFFLHH